MINISEVVFWWGGGRDGITIRDQFLHAQSEVGSAKTHGRLCSRDNGDFSLTNMWTTPRIALGMQSPNYQTKIIILTQKLSSEKWMNYYRDLQNYYPKFQFSRTLCGLIRSVFIVVKPSKIKMFKVQVRIKTTILSVFAQTKKKKRKKQKCTEACVVSHVVNGKNVDR